MSAAVEDEVLKHQLQRMDDWDFEHFVADLWTQQGWTTEVEQQSNDAGVDVRAEKSVPYPQKQLIQVKRYGDSTAVGGPAVQQYASLKQQEQGVDSAIIVTTSHFTESAKQRARELNVKLIDGDDLLDIINRQHAHDLVDEYLDLPDPKPESEPEDGSEEVVSEDQFEVISLPLLSFQLPKGFAPADATPAKTLRYYAIWVGIAAWLLSLLYLGSFAFWELATIGWILTPLAIALDARTVGVFSPADKDWWFFVAGSAIPGLGLVAVAGYLIIRRGLRLDLLLHHST